MIESVIIFILGILTATLIALIIYPFLKQRVEHSAPNMSDALPTTELLQLDDLALPEDKFASLQIYIKHKEMAFQKLNVLHIKNLSELANLRDEFKNLELKLSDTEKQLQESCAAFTNSQAELIFIRNEKSEVENIHTLALQDLEFYRDNVKRLNDELEAMQGQSAQLTILLDERSSEFEAACRRVADLERDNAAEQERGLVIERRLRDIESECDTKVMQATTQLALLQAQVSSYQAEKTDHFILSEDIQTKLDKQTLLIENLEKSLFEQASLLEATRTQFEAEQKTLTNLMEQLKAEKLALEGGLTASREDRARLEAELRYIRREAAKTIDTMRVENQTLVQEINDIANMMMNERHSKDD